MHSYLHKNGARLTLKTFYIYVCQIADAMKYLEKNRIVHRDLAARNILLVQEDCVSLSSVFSIHSHTHAHTHSHTHTLTHTHTHTHTHMHTHTHTHTDRRLHTNAYAHTQVKLSDFGMARVLDEQSDVYNLSNLGARIPVAWSVKTTLTFL